jgi:hypothetical protein
VPSTDLSIQDAKREPVAVSILLAGPSGAGKTFTALRLGRGLAGPSGLIVLVDTEVKPASLYANDFKFKHIRLPKPFEPERYREAVRLAMTLKPAVLIIDSATHEWIGSGGILPTLDKIPGTNQMVKWKDLTPRHERFVDTITSQKCHTIVCVRAKERYVMEETKRDDGSKKVDVKRVGLRPIQRRDFFYDFMVSFVLDPDSNNARLLNNTIEYFRNHTPHRLTEDDGKAIAAWALGGKRVKK